MGINNSLFYSDYKNLIIKVIKCIKKIKTILFMGDITILSDCY